MESLIKRLEEEHSKTSCSAESVGSTEPQQKIVKDLCSAIQSINVDLQTSKVHSEAKLKSMQKTIDTYSSKVQSVMDKQIHSEDKIKNMQKTIDSYSSKMQSVGDKIMATLKPLHKTNATKKASKKAASETASVNYPIPEITNSDSVTEFIWELEKFPTMVQNAKSGKTAIVYSNPFFSHRFGCKMCLKIYPHGCGDFHTTHLSVYLVVQKGPMANISVWPICYIVDVMLLDQKNGKSHFVKKLPCAPLHAEQKPVTGKFVEWGCKGFAPLGTVQDNTYMVNNTVFIKAVVSITSR